MIIKVIFFSCKMSACGASPVQSRNNNDHGKFKISSILLTSLTSLINVSFDYGYRVKYN